MLRTDSKIEIEEEQHPGVSSGSAIAFAGLSCLFEEILVELVLLIYRETPRLLT